jgi:hypothetical protein
VHFAAHGAPAMRPRIRAAAGGAHAMASRCPGTGGFSSRSPTVMRRQSGKP